jgi:hypothetical protein
MFNFDGSNLGKIDELIKTRNYKNGKLYTIELKINDLVLGVKKYKTPFALILNEAKKIFNVSFVDYNLVNIDNIVYLAYKYNNSVSLQDYHENNDFKGKIRHIYLQRTFVFNWLMFVNSNHENKIHVVPRKYCNDISVDTINSDAVTFVTTGEKSFKFKDIKYNISNNVIEEWFDGSRENFYDVVSKMIKPIDPELLRIELLKIVKKYDESYVSWVNIVYKNIIQHK